MSYLVLVRHGESEWNAKGLWTGWADPPLTELGHKQARDAGITLKDIHFDMAYTSALIRAIQTLQEIKDATGQNETPTISDKALNERDYGDYTGKNKWEVKSVVGEEEFQKIRRSWDYQLPKGESLQDVYHRVIPYFEKNILPLLKNGKNVIIASSGNALRVIVKYLENITDEDISQLEIGIGDVLAYQIDEQGKMVKKEIRANNPLAGKQ